MRRRRTYSSILLALRRMLRRPRRSETKMAVLKEDKSDAPLDDKERKELTGLVRSFQSITSNLREQLRARDQLLLDRSHELRAPLARMRIALETAPPGTSTDTLREEINALDKMVTEILETERLNSPAGQHKRELVEIGRLISETIAQFKGRTPGIQKKWVDPIVLKVDAERMRLVLRNVLEQALKHGAKAQQPVEVTLRREGGFAILVVRDFGPGIPENELRLGFGLPICKRIVEAHRGRFLLASGVGEGTRVTIELPLS